MALEDPAKKQWFGVSEGGREGRLVVGSVSFGVCLQGIHHIRPRRSLSFQASRPSRWMPFEV